MAGGHSDALVDGQSPRLASWLIEVSKPELRPDLRCTQIILKLAAAGSAAGAGSAVGAVKGPEFADALAFSEASANEGRPTAMFTPALPQLILVGLLLARLVSEN